MKQILTFLAGAGLILSGLTFVAQAAPLTPPTGDIQTENAQLATDKQTLQTTIDGLNTTIANMTAVFAGLGYNPDGTPITPSE